MTLNVINLKENRVVLNLYRSTPVLAGGVIIMLTLEQIY